MIPIPDFLKRKWPWLLLPLTLGIVWWIGWGRGVVPERAVPSQTALLFELEGYAPARQQVEQSDTAIVGRFLQSPLWRSLWEDPGLLIRWSRDAPDIMRQIAGNRMLAAYSLLENDSLHPVFIVQMDARVDLEAWLQTLPETTRYLPAQFHGHTIFTLHSASGQTMVVAARGKLLLFSRFSYLVEDALVQSARRSSWWTEHRFRPAGPADFPVRVSLNPERLFAHLAPWLTPEWREKTQSAAAAGWLGFQWNGQKVSLQLDAGLLPAPDPLEGLADLSRVVPDNPSVLFAMNHAGKLGMLYGGNKQIYEDYIAGWAGHEIAYVAGEPLGATLHASGCWLLAARDAQAAEKALLRYGQQQGLVREYEYQTYRIREFLRPDLLGPLAGASANPAAVILENFVVVAPSPSVLETWIDKFIVNQTLANRPGWLLLQQRLPERVHGLVLLNGANAAFAAREMLPYATRQNRSAELKLLRQAGFIAFPLEPAGSGRIGATVLSQPLQAAEESASLLWKTELAGRAVSTPEVFLDPAGGGALDILVQDATHQLYCLDANGRIRWRRQLDGPLISRIFRQQLPNQETGYFLFNTEKRIYLLDPEGNDMPGYPVNLQSPASNGLIAVDFDGGGDLQYFVGCRNGNLYGFDRHGRPARGWNPVAIGTQVRLPLVHARDAKNDYLLVSDAQARLWAFSRFGERKFGPVQLQGTPAGPPRVERYKDRIRIFSANTDGRLFLYTAEGALSASLQGVPAGKTPAALAFSDAGPQQRARFALLAGNRLVGWHYRGDRLTQQFARQLPAPQDTLFALPGQYLGALNRTQKRIALFTPDGKTAQGFPLAGSTGFALTPDEAPIGYRILLTGYDQALFAYRVPE